MMNLFQTGGKQETPVFSNLSDLKLKRDEYNLQIRREKRDESLRLKRASNLDFERRLQSGSLKTTNVSYSVEENLELEKYISEWANREYTMKEFFELVENINSDNRLKQHFGTIGLRKLLSKDEPPIDLAIENNVVSKLIQFLQFENEPYLQLEATWCLLNIASGTTDQTMSIIEKDGHLNIINLLKSPKNEILEVALWALGNIAGDGPKLRDVIIEANAIEPIVQILELTTQPDLIKMGVWVLANLCKDKLPIPFELIERVIVILCRVIQKCVDPEVLVDAVWAVNILSHENLQIQRIIESGVLNSLVILLDNQRLSTLVPVISIFGNIAASEEIYTETLLQFPNLIPKLFKLTVHPKIVVKKKVCWTLSNFMAGNENYIGVILNDLSYLVKLISMTVAEPLEVKKEAVWALSNATQRCNVDQLVFMLQNGIMNCFCDLLDINEDAEILQVVLIGLNGILNKGAQIGQQSRSENPFLETFEQLGGVQKVDILQTHKSDEVYEAAQKFLSKYYDLDDA